jgi:hypothetical protein
MHIPLVNASQEIVGWTQVLPRLKSGRLRHDAAERLLGDDIVCTPVFLSQEADIVRAGAQPGVLIGCWTLALGPISCLVVSKWGLSVRSTPKIAAARVEQSEAGQAASA